MQSSAGGLFPNLSLSKLSMTQYGAGWKLCGLRRPLAGMVVLAAGLGVLGGCASRKTPAPVVNLSTAQVSANTVINTAADTYTVRAGDTLFSIARSFRTSVAELMRLNDLLDPNRLWAGQVLRLRDGAPQTPQTPPVQTARAESPQPAATPATTNKPATTGQIRPTVQTPATPPAQPPAQQPPAQRSAAQSTTRPATPPATPSPSWGWPAQGSIIRNFSANTKGIDIAGKAGDPVLAAAAGTVRYVGNGVRGLGWLVLIEHGNDFMTAYAHNQKLLVTAGQQVKKGERIALLGMSDTTSPRLHFQIRRNGTPVSPMTYLPKK